MTLRFATITALTLAVLSPPAFAHGSGHGGNGMSQSMPSHMTSPSNTTSPSNMGSNNNHMHNGTKLSVQQLEKIGAMIAPRFTALKNQFFTALTAGNKALAAHILRELNALSRYEAKFHLSTGGSFVDGRSISIGFGAHGGVLINGQIARI